AEFERELIAERTIAGLASGPAPRRAPRPPFHNTAPHQSQSLAAIGNPQTNDSPQFHEKK
ncbi:hypothetical protein ACVGWI_23755, partial [Enterobacter hormaechei]